MQSQALNSIKFKKFHAQGGSVYSLYPKVDPTVIVRFIVAFQTISDYLDNLCDRAGVADEASFRHLHMAMFDALIPAAGKTHDYYQLYPYKNDNGYLEKLVQCCQSQLSKLPSFSQVQSYLQKYVQFYTDLQSYKHLHPNIRETLLSVWAKKQSELYPQIFWWEFSAATGSTLAIFLMIAAATDPSLTRIDIDRMDSVYFPWINGLHILLDYYIDAMEDVRMGDLNFTSYYESLSQCRERLHLFVEKSYQDSSVLPYPLFHRTVIQGLLAMYLSDTKALSKTNKSITQKILLQGGIQTIFYYQCCRFLRMLKKI